MSELESLQEMAIVFGVRERDGKLAELQLKS